MTSENRENITFGTFGSYGSIRIKGRMTAQKTSFGTGIVANYSYKTRSIELAMVWIDYYTPRIYAEGYIVFVFPFICSFVRLFVRSYFLPSHRIASKFCVKVSQVVYISATTHQKALIF